jgi:hypothetical protein
VPASRLPTITVSSQVSRAGFIVLPGKECSDSGRATSDVLTPGVGSKKERAASRAGKYFHDNGLPSSGDRAKHSIGAVFVPSSLHLVARSPRRLPESAERALRQSVQRSPQGKDAQADSASHPRPFRCAAAGRIHRVTVDRIITWNAAGPRDWRVRRAWRRDSFRTRTGGRHEPDHGAGVA